MMDNFELKRKFRENCALQPVKLIEAFEFLIKICYSCGDCVGDGGGHVQCTSNYSNVMHRWTNMN